MSERLLALLADFRQVWLADTEYHVRLGARVRGICHAARELRTDTRVSRWTWDRDPGPCPWDPDDPSIAIVCYSAVAECSYFLSCGWRLPRNIIDLWIARRITSNGRIPPSRHALIPTLKEFGIPHDVDTAEKRHWRNLCKGGGPFTKEDEPGLLRYNESDIEPLEELADILLPQVDLGQLLEFGRYSAHVAQLEWRGIPLDVERHSLLCERFAEVQASADVRANLALRFELFGGRGRHPTSFSPARAKEWLTRTGLISNWPFTELSGQPALDKVTLKSLQGRHEDLVHLKQGRVMTTMRHPRHIHIDDGGRCRNSILPFMAATSRNSPTANWPLAYPSPMRALIVPQAPYALLVADVDQADSGVAAGLSEDAAMRAAYFSPKGNPDFYLSFAVQARALVEGASRTDPKVELTRNMYKTAANAIMYSSGAENLSHILGEPFHVAKAKIQKHKYLYPKYWKKAADWAAIAAFDGVLETPSGWRAYNLGPTSAMNFPMQSAGADILRLASLRIEAAGIGVVFPLHDSVAAEVPADKAEDAKREMVKAIGDASEQVAGIRLRVSTQIVGSGQRYFKDEKAEQWWNDISRRLGVEP